MNRSLFLAALLFATGCSSAAVTSAESTQDLVEAAPLVQTVSTSAGDVLANGSGLSLYTFDNDTTSESTCYDGCAARWPALIVPAYTTVVAPFATTTRRDGQAQLTLGGHPLYTFAGDSAQGDVNGDGLGGVWHLARPSVPTAPVKTVTTTAGDVLANEAGLSLYTFDKDTTVDSTCYDACAARWPALTVAADATLPSPFGTSTRRDGTTQLTLDGHPLYTFAGDVAEGDVNGDGIGGVWHLARPASN